MAEAATEFLITDREEDRPVVRVLGAWTIDHAKELAAAVDGLELDEAGAGRIDAEGLEDLDTLGAWLLAGVCERLRTDDRGPELEGTNERQQALLEEVQEKRAELSAIEPERRSLQNVLGDSVAALGRHIVVGLAEARDFLIFVGATLVSCIQIVLQRERFSLTSVFHHMQQVWINALPIVGLLGFLSGAVIVYQGTTQLQRFGASTLAINMVGIVVLREIGVLLAALLVGGRSGSSFAAQIGAMKAQREVDAMIASGIDPTAALVVPRIAALFITFPLLGFFSTIMALVGGGLMAWFELGLGPAAYITRLLEAITPATFYVGMIKTPVFASIIGLVGCFQGLRVEGTAAEVGRLTTRSVVQTIFLIIATDAMFTIFFRFVDV